MSELPFPLSKRHKHDCRNNWEKRGMIFVDDEHFEYVYNEYIHATHCDLCNKEFLKSRDRQLDHCYDTGDPRNIVCQHCNHIRKDNKIQSNNKTGERDISKCKDKNYKTGYCFYIKILRNGKNLLNTKRSTLEAAIKCRDDFIAANPGIYT